MKTMRVKTQQAAWDLRAILFERGMDVKLVEDHDCIILCYWPKEKAA